MPPATGGLAPASTGAPAQASVNSPKVSAPIAVAPGVVQQKVGQQTVTSSAQAFNAATGTVQSLAEVPDIPFVVPKDFSNQKVVVSAVKSTWSNPQKVQATMVVDGDGLRGSYEKGGDFVCRITGIDAPETAKPGKVDRQGNPDPGQKYGRYAAQTLEKLIKDKQVQVQVSLDPRDKKYNRDLCLITVNGDNISRSLVEAGAAYLYENYVKPEMAKELSDAQSKAIKAKVGVWQNPDEERPWDYRRRTKEVYQFPEK